MNPHIILAMMDGYNEREMAELKKENMLAHLQGQYFAAAISATVGNMFKKRGHKPNEYPEKPFEIKSEQNVQKENTETLTDEDKERQTRALFMQLKIMGSNFNLSHQKKESK